MSYADVVTQMQAIQTQFAQLGLLKTSTASTSTSAASFASALDGASTTPAGSSGAISTSSAASADGALVSPNGATGDQVVDAALGYKGVPYVLGGESKSGIDCSGLVQAAFGTLGVAVPRTVHEQKVLGEKVDSLKEAKPGDLIVLNGGDHIAIYMGNDTVIHAPYPGRTVSVQKAWFTDKDITTIRRIVPSTADGAATATDAAAATAASSVTGGSGTSPTGLSAATVMKATAMLTTYGSGVGLYGTSSSSSDSSGGTSLSSLLASFGLSGTTASGSASTSSTSAQQIIAARAALLGTSTS
jgi:cell wall-associated NlpC family hydrolase